MPSTVTCYMNYAIYFTDRAEFDAAVGTYGPIINTCPKNAAILFDMEYPQPGGALGAKGMYDLEIWVISPPGIEIGFPGPSGVLADPTVNTVSVPGQLDPFGNPFPDGLFIWSGSFCFLGGGALGVMPPTPVPLPQRNWAVGFELPSGGETNNNGVTPTSRDSSRTQDGYGLCLRNSTTSYSLPVALFDPTLQQSASWERFYVRIRTLPAANHQIWNCHGFPQDSSGGRIEVTPTGALALSNVALTTPTLVGTTTALALNVFYRLDVLLNYNNAALDPSDPAGDHGRLRIYINGINAIDATIPSISGGMGQPNNRHIRSTLSQEGPPAHGLEIDIDDWTCAAIPSLGGAENLNSLDWLTGTHIQKINATGLAPTSSPNWVGDYRVALEDPAFASVGRFTSSTSGARLGVTTDAAAGPLSQFGAASMTVGIFGSRVSVDGVLGYAINGGSVVLSTIAQQSTASWNSVMYRPVGLTPTAPPPYPPNTPTLPSIFPIALYHEKGASSAASAIGMLQATVEYVGAWGPEDGNIDDPAVPPVIASAGIHNAPYSQYEVASLINNPMRAVVVAAGVYAGNSLGQDIDLPFPAHWWWVRRVDSISGIGPHHWHSSALTSSWANTDRVVPDIVARAKYVGGNAAIQVSGNDPEINKTGETYQWIAVCDPGMRYVLNGSFSHPVGLGPTVNDLIDPAFSPDAVFCQIEILFAISNVVNYWYKGPGYAAATAQRMDQVETANTLALGTGVLSSQGLLNNASTANNCGISYAACRMADGSGDPGVVFQILSYTGDGTGSRVVALSPVSNRYPLFVEVLAHTGGNAGMFFRDPSHVGNQSSTHAGAITTNGITAGGIDTITVGSVLNAMGVVYDVFVIPGSPTGWGTDSNGSYVPVAPVGGGGVYPSDTSTPINPIPPPPIVCSDGWGEAQPGGLPYVPLLRLPLT